MLDYIEHPALITSTSTVKLCHFIIHLTSNFLSISFKLFTARYWLCSLFLVPVSQRLPGQDSGGGQVGGHGGITSPGSPLPPPPPPSLHWANLEQFSLSYYCCLLVVLVAQWAAKQTNETTPKISSELLQTYSSFLSECCILAAVETLYIVGLPKTY